MKVQHVTEAQASSSLMPSCIRPYLKAIENIGEAVENITATSVVATRALLKAAELSEAMVQLRLEEVSSQLSVRPSLT